MDVNYRLFQAVRCGELQRVRELIDSYGLSYSKAWSKGYVLLCDAIMGRHTTVAKLLLTRGSKVNKSHRNPNLSDTPLHLAVGICDIEIIQLILDRGGNVDAKNSLGRTPLHIAVEKNNMEVMSILIHNGATVCAQDNEYGTILHRAVSRRCLPIVQYLLKYQTFLIDTEGIRRYTPLHYAAEVSSEDFITLLLSSNASVNAKGEDGITPLHIAAKKGYISNVENLINNGACINSSTVRKGYTPLHFASELDNEKTVKLFLDKNADINATTKDNETPLHIAMKSRCEAVVKLLLQYGAKVDSQDKDGKTILYLAVENMNFTIVENILKFCPDINNQSNRNALTIAVLRREIVYYDIANALLKYGLNVNPGDANNLDLLNSAVEKGYLKIVEYLLKYGAKVNLQNSTGFTPLHIATKNKREEVAKLLVNYEADINAQDKTGKTSIYYAIKNSDSKIFKLLLTNKANIRDNPDLLNIAVEKECVDIAEALLQHGADINASDENGRTALHFTALTDYYATRKKLYWCPSSEIAKQFLRKYANVDAQNESCCISKFYNVLELSGYSKVVLVSLLKYIATVSDARGQIAKLILCKGANVDALDKKGFTTLHAAIECEYVKVVEALLEYNANVNLEVNGLTPLHRSAQRGNSEISTMILKKGANVNAYKKDGTTALHIATQGGHKAVVQVLLKHGANVDYKTIAGKTPLHVAAQHGYQDIIETLLNYGADMESREVNGLTALYIASCNGHHKVVLTLLEYGADINFANKNNVTPLGRAVYELKYRRENYEINHLRRQNYNYDYDYDYNYDYDDDFESRTVMTHAIVVKALVRHIVSTKASNLYVSEENLATSHKYPIKDFFVECEKEIASMKIEKINNSYISFFDILAKTTHSLAIYLRNENILQHLKSVDYISKFPIYGVVMGTRVRKGIERKELFEQANKIINFPVLPYECNEKILSYLSEQDLKCFMGPVKFSYPYYAFVDSNELYSNLWDLYSSI